MSSPSLTGYSPQNPRRYLGPNVGITTIVVRNRIPTGADIKQPNTGKYYPFGTQWLVGETSPGVAPVSGAQGDIWYLAYIANNIANWVKIATSAVTLGFTINLQVFTSSATYTPTANMVFSQVEGMGSGGGGGGVASTTTSQFAQGGGGAGGEYAMGIFNAATIGASQAITIGVAGAGGVAGNNIGSTGGACSLGSLLTVNGGLGGSGCPAMATSLTVDGGLGGAGGAGGSVRFQGNFGGPGYASTSDQLGSGGAGAGGRYSGGVPQNGGTGTAGSIGTGYGGGGSGASNKSTNIAMAGGNGTPGIIVITEYIST
jgi:hypothetical protein